MLTFVIHNIEHNEAIGGICALNQLGNELSKRGERVILAGRNKTPGYGGELLSGDLSDLNLENPVAVYPEILVGNPYEFSNVVRWVLAIPPTSTAETWAERDLVFLWSNLYDFATKTPPIGRLFTAYLRRTVFCDRGDARSGECYAIRKGTGKPLIHSPDAECVDGYRGDDFLANVFNRCHRFFCYDQQTMLTLFSAMCGCEPIVTPEAGFNLEKQLAGDPLSALIAWGLDDRDRASAARSGMAAMLDTHVADSEESIDNFIRECYDRFSGGK